MDEDMSFGVGKRTAGLAGYQILGVLAREESQVLFSALRVHPLLERRWPVTLKVFGDLAAAKAEAGHLLDLHGCRFFPCLMGFFEARSDDFRAYLEGFHYPHFLECGQTRDLQGRNCPFPPGKVGVLALPSIHGLPLVNRIERLPRRCRLFRGICLLAQDARSGHWLRYRFRWRLSLTERIEILAQLAQAMAACHERGIVLGDLRPERVWYDRNHRKIGILDFGGSKTSGSPGWRAPEQFTRAEGVGVTWTSAADVYLLGLWLKRFLAAEPSTNPLLRLGDRCCRQDPNLRPASDEVRARIEAFSPARCRHPGSDRNEIRWAKPGRPFVSTRR